MALDHLTVKALSRPRREEFTQDGELLATWWRQSSPGCYYWRCLLPARRLPGQVLRFVSSDLAERSDGELWWPRMQGACVWQFPGNATTGTLMRGMQTDGIRVLMDVDDNYLRVPDVMVNGGLTSGWQVGLDRNGSTDKYSFEAHARIARFVDGIIVATPALADLYSQLNPNVYVCRNSVEPTDWPEPEQRHDGVLRIGWAASHSHKFDAPLVRRALKWAADQPNVEVYTYGVGEVYKFPGRVRKVAWTDDLTEYRRSLSLCDVHICPLIETDWSRHKSDIKAMEAAMAGAWPIVSSAEPYRPWHDRTMVCTTAKDWEDAMRWVVRHRDEIPALARKAKEYVLAERTVEHEISRWREAVAG